MQELDLDLKKMKIGESFEVWAMAASFKQDDTGLPMIVWFSTKGAIKHGPRIKVQKNHNIKTQPQEMVSVTISDTPKIIAGQGLSNKDFKLIAKYIEINKKVLLEYWEDEISTPALVQKLQKLPKEK